ncbi:MAG TPA: hypothetical protein VJN71_10845 [Nitrososphaerales archaeon]|nr:hypothetical protein [Nitrososphaerales archaeon]
MSDDSIDDLDDGYSNDSSSDSGTVSFTTGQLWGALRKTWKAYKISKAQGNELAMMKYAHRIRSLQSKLGLDLSRFAEVGLN